MLTCSLNSAAERGLGSVVAGWGEQAGRHTYIHISRVIHNVRLTGNTIHGSVTKDGAHSKMQRGGRGGGAWNGGVDSWGLPKSRGAGRGGRAANCPVPLTPAKVADPGAGTDSEDLRGGLHRSL